MAMTTRARWSPMARVGMSSVAAALDDGRDGETDAVGADEDAGTRVARRRAKRERRETDEWGCAFVFDAS